MSDESRFLDNPRMMYGGWFADAGEPLDPPIDLDVLTPEQRRLVEVIARGQAARELNLRTIPRYPTYFIDGQWLVTYDWMQQERLRTQLEITQLHQKIDALTRPWWERLAAWVWS